MADALEAVVEELKARIERLEDENRRLRNLLGLGTPDRAAPVTSWDPRLLPPGSLVECVKSVDHSSSPEDKIALFRSLFFGREDVFALHWENERTGKKGWSPAVEGGWVNARKPGRSYLPVTDEVVADHLTGSHHVGIYPLLRGDGCRLLACDFDGPGWVLDALAYLDAARTVGVPAVLEQSRSGDGAHVWIFFDTTVPAASARLLGVHLIREAMTVRAEIDLASYDRLFPTQDFMPRGSFGNLIALPLNGTCRKRRTTLFLDPTTLEPYEDQWSYLSKIERVSSEALASITAAIDPIGAGPESATYRRPRASRPPPKAPEVVRARMEAMLGIQRSSMPPALLSSLKHLASLHNPDFYEKERLRFSTWNTPRFIRSYAETLDRILLPRGLVARAAAIVREAGSRLVVEHGCVEPDPIAVAMTATLTPEQESAADALADHDHGVLVAPPGSGKTVIACSLIARHAVPTLVIVDRKPLVEQWRDRLATHLDVPLKEVGQVTAGGKRAKGTIDLAMAQSLARMDDLVEVTSGYGLVIVDECHHVPAVTFERCVRGIPVRRWIGLTATPYRRDGLEDLITMYCGPIRHRIRGVEPLSLPHNLVLSTHPTSFSVPEDEDLGVQEVFRALVEDTDRTEMICDGVQDAVEGGRNCLVLTQWTEHIARLKSALLSRGLSPLVLQGGMGKKARIAVLAELQQECESGGALLLATGSFLGEGFDFPLLDTLFLAFPIAFKGRVVQYVGRVLRPVAGKDSVEVHDYVDELVPMLARMHRKRLPGFTSLGFEATANRIR